MNIRTVHPKLDIASSTTNYQVRISDELEDPDWDAFLEKTPGGHHVQTSLWAQLKASFSWRTVRILVTQGEKIIAGAQLLMRTLPLAGVDHTHFGQPKLLLYKGNVLMFYAEKVPGSNFKFYQRTSLAWIVSISRF